MIEKETVTIIVAGLGIIGTLGGIVAGHFLSRSSQRRQWMLDRRHEEFKELLGGLAASIFAEVETTYTSVELTPEERRTKTRSTADFFRIVRTRIFTFNDVKRLDLERKWLAALNDFQTRRPHDLETFDKKFEALRQELVEAATAQEAD